MSDVFAQEIQTIVGPLLSNLGFMLDEIDDHVDEGGMLGSVVYYRSKDCKIQVYQSSREGSMNCMIARAEAPNRFGPLDRSCQWQYLTTFAPTPETSLEELVESVSFESMTSTEQLGWVRDNVDKNYDVAREEILGMR